MVLLLMMGFDQKPKNVMYPMVKKMKHIPNFKFVRSDILLIISGPTAPPTIAEHKMPAKEP